MSDQNNKEIEEKETPVELTNEEKKQKQEKAKLDKTSFLKKKLEKNKGRKQREQRLTGVVASVPSGDKVQIIPSERLYARNGGVNPITVKLNGVNAPSLEWVEYETIDAKGQVVEVDEGDDEEGVDEGKKVKKEKRKIRHPDEEFAWSSREFLRQNLIGRPVIYRLQNQLRGSVYFGDVWIVEGGDLIDIREEAIINGWVSVQRRPNLENSTNDSPAVKEYKRIRKLEDKAKDQELGIHCTSRAKAQASIRHVHKHKFNRKDNKAAFDLFEKIKEIPQHGVVEAVHSGTSLRIILLDRMDEITVDLAGVKSPGKVKGRKDVFKPYGEEAKGFTSHYLLNRDVIVYLELMDSHNNFYATVQLKDNPDFDITILLLQNGLANLVEWSVSKGAYITELQAAEQAAKDNNLKIWHSFEEGKERMSDKFQLSGKVVEVVNSGSFRVLPAGSVEPVFIKLSSVQPLYERLGDKFESLHKDIQKEREKDSAFSFMATDFTRKLLIGKKVTCIEDYRHNNNRYFSVFLKDLNVSLRILEEGWARVTSHAAEGDRSPQYQQMVLAYNRAAKALRGVHGSISNAQTNFNDLTFFDQKKINDDDDEETKKEKKSQRSQIIQKTQMFLGFFQRAGKVHAVIEGVLSASKYTIRIPSENNCRIRFAQEGVKSEKKIKEKTDSKSPLDLYPPGACVGNAGYHYTRSQLYQRDVQVVIASLDTYGIFYGRLYINGQDYSFPLLQEGFCKIYRNQAVTMEEFEGYRSAENAAKAKRKGLWKDYDPKEAERRKAERIAEKNKEKELVVKDFNIFITEILDGSRFWYQNRDSADALNDLMSEVAQQDLESQPAFEPRPNDLVFAKFNADGNYYRSQVNRIRKTDDSQEYSLLFVDYGNVQMTSGDDIRQLDKSKFGFDRLPAQAKEGKLAYVKTPKLTQDYGYEAATFFKDLVFENPNLVASGTGRDLRSNVDILNIGDNESRIFINGALVAAGLAQVERTRSKSKAIHKKLAELEIETKEKRVNIWKHGEPPDSDEEREEERRMKGLL